MVFTMKTFTINGHDYKSKPVDFNLMCDLEEMGAPLQDGGKKHFSTARAYFAICAGLSNEAAGKEIEAHIISGGTLKELNNAFSEELEKSDFFRSLIKTAETEDAENQSEESKKK